MIPMNQTKALTVNIDKNSEQFIITDSNSRS